MLMHAPFKENIHHRICGIYLVFLSGTKIQVLLNDAYISFESWTFYVAGAPEGNLANAQEISNQWLRPKIASNAWQ